MLYVTEKHGPTESGRVKGLRADVRVQSPNFAPSRDELLPDLVAWVSNVINGSITVAPTGEPSVQVYRLLCNRLMEDSLCQ